MKYNYYICNVIKKIIIILYLLEKQDLFKYTTKVYLTTEESGIRDDEYFIIENYEVYDKVVFELLNIALTLDDKITKILKNGGKVIFRECMKEKYQFYLYVDGKPFYNDLLNDFCCFIKFKQVYEKLSKNN